MKILNNGNYSKIIVFVVLLLGISLYATLGILAEVEGTLEKVKALAVDGSMLETAEELNEEEPQTSEEEVENQEDIPLQGEEIEVLAEDSNDDNPKDEADETKEKTTKEENIKENQQQDGNKLDQIKESTTSQRKVAESKVSETNTETQSNENENSENQRGRQVDLNSYILSVIKTYPTNGSYPYLLNNDYKNYNGVTVNLHYQNKLLLKAHPSGNRASHCSGITFEVFFKAMQQRNKEAGISVDDFNGMNYDELYDYALTWYVANGSKKSSNMAIAMEKYGVGKRIKNFEDAKAGDFLDFSRENNTGHTVVFLNWIRDHGKIVGLRYWSSQGSTNGIQYNEEYFNVKRSDGTKYGNLMIDQVYIGRVTSINEYK